MAGSFPLGFREMNGSTLVSGNSRYLVEYGTSSSSGMSVIFHGFGALLCPYRVTGWAEFDWPFGIVVDIVNGG